MGDMKLKEIAAKIQAHLSRIERDPKINPPRPNFGGTRAYYNARAMRACARIRVIYVSYQGGQTCLKDEAVGYLAWLDAGHVGKLHEMRSEGGGT